MIIETRVTQREDFDYGRSSRSFLNAAFPVLSLICPSERTTWTRFTVHQPGYLKKYTLNYCLTNLFLHYSQHSSVTRTEYSHARVFLQIVVAEQGRFCGFSFIVLCLQRCERNKGECFMLPFGCPSHQVLSAGSRPLSPLCLFFFLIYSHFPECFVFRNFCQMGPDEDWFYCARSASVTVFNMHSFGSRLPWLWLIIINITHLCASWLHFILFYCRIWT